MTIMNVENSQPIGISPTTKQNAASKNESYAQHFRAKYPLLPPCNSKCSLSCTEKVDKDFRHGIWYKFRSFRFKERWQWLDAHVTVLNVKKRKRNTLKARLRKYSLLYTLPKPDGTEVRVCKKMFLATLGARTDGIVMKLSRQRSVLLKGLLYLIRKDEDVAKTLETLLMKLLLLTLKATTQ